MVNIERPISLPFLSNMGPSYKHAAMYIYTALGALITDSQLLGSLAVTSACKKKLKSEDEKTQEDARSRLKGLGKWNKCKHPFAWGEGGDGTVTYKLLISILPVDDEGCDPLTTSTLRLTYTELVEQLIKSGLSMKVQAPLVKNGICPISLATTVPLIQARTNSDNTLFFFKFPTLAL